MSFKTIRHAQSEIWPEVRKSLDLIRANRAAVEQDPTGATRAARSRAQKPWNRVVADEAVWAVAKADLLTTPPQQNLIKVAKRWAKEVGPDMDRHPEDFDSIDFELRDAVNNLALDFASDEGLHNSPDSATVLTRPGSTGKN